ncbi:hypothetical protein X975_23992, partial [Stegodyphus mimosarum]
MNTVCNKTHLLRFHDRGAALKPLITKSNYAAQLMLCTAHQQWISGQWKQVLWRDESRFTRYGLDGIIWHLPGKDFVEGYILHSWTL